MVKENLTRVVLVQDYCLLRNALAERLSREPMIEVCAHASCGMEVCELVARQSPQLVLMNISLKNPAGVSLLKRLKRSFKGLAILTFSCDSEFEHLNAELAMRAGAAGYVSSVDDEEILIQAIDKVMKGETYLSRHLNLFQTKKADDHLLFSRLSLREVEVFCLTGCGHMTKGIAEKLNLSSKTIESYRERIREKMGLKDGAELLYAATCYMRRAVQLRSGPERRIRAGELSATLQRAG